MSFGLGESGSLLGLAILANGVIGPGIQAAIASYPAFERETSRERHAFSVGPEISLQARQCRASSTARKLCKKATAASDPSAFSVKAKRNINSDSPVFTSDRLNRTSQPPPECCSTLGRQAIQPAAAQAVRVFHYAEDESPGLQAFQCGINGARAAAVVSHRRFREDLAQVVTRAGLLLDQPQQRISQNGSRLVGFIVRNVL